MKTILIYSTKYGCTEQAAKRIQAALGGETALFNIMKDSVPPLDTYDTVILGGSVYIGKVQKQLTAYMSSHLEQLLDKNVSLFLCAGAPKGEEQAKELQNAFPEALFKQAVVKDVLGYAYSFDKMGFFEKLIMKKIKGNTNNSAEFYDEQIALFVQSIKQCSK
jgi:menaquinone-dependent protoporphyrinogen oxidase